MFVHKYLNRLTNKLSKDNILSDLKSTKLASNTLASTISTMVEFTSGNKPPKRAIFLYGQIYVDFKGVKKKDFINTLHYHHSNIANVIEEVTKEVEDKFPEVLITKNSNMAIVATLSYIEQINLYINYSSSLLAEVAKSYVEAVAKNPSDIYETAVVTERYLLKNKMDYSVVWNTLAKGPKEFTTTIRTIPNVRVTSDNEEVIAATLATYKHNPVSKLSSNFIGSPIYTLRKWLSDIRINKYNVLKERQTQIQMLLVDLENQKHSNPSPSLQKEIERTEDRIRTIDYKIAQMEE